MTRTLIPLTFLLSGCMTASVTAHRADMARLIAEHEMGCSHMVVVDSLRIPPTTRYTLDGCGRRVVYACRDAPGRQRTALDVMVVGEASIEADCRRVK
jgi:hypothetical protein